MKTRRKEKKFAVKNWKRVPVLPLDEELEHVNRQLQELQEFPEGKIGGKTGGEIWAEKAVVISSLPERPAGMPDFCRTCPEEEKLSFFRRLLPKKISKKEWKAMKKAEREVLWISRKIEKAHGLEKVVPKKVLKRVLQSKDELQQLEEKIARLKEGRVMGEELEAVGEELKPLPEIRKRPEKKIAEKIFIQEPVRKLTGKPKEKPKGKPVEKPVRKLMRKLMRKKPMREPMGKPAEKLSKEPDAKLARTVPPPPAPGLFERWKIRREERREERRVRKRKAREGIKEEKKTGKREKGEREEKPEKKEEIKKEREGKKTGKGKYGGLWSRKKVEKAKLEGEKKIEEMGKDKKIAAESKPAKPKTPKTEAFKREIPNREIPKREILKKDFTHLVSELEEAAAHLREELKK